MKKTCSWCGEPIGFFDISYEVVQICKKGHWICGRCCGKIEHAKIGHTTFLEIATGKTDPELFDYYAEPEKSREEILQQENKNKEQERIKREYQEINPLYEDIHQIAGDLRFIKNFLIFCIILGVIFSLMLAASLQ